LWLEAAHHGAHGLHARGARGADRLVDQRLEFVVAELGGEKFLDHGDLGRFLGGEFGASGVFVLGLGVAALLDHLVEDGEHARFVELDALVDLDALELGLDEANGGEPLPGATLHGVLHGRLDRSLRCRKAHSCGYGSGYGA
jgi:hypothetical protein